MSATSFPSTITAGFTLAFSFPVPTEFNGAAGYALSFVLQSADGKIAIASGNATADGDAFDVEVSAATTAGWAAGQYTWQAVCASGSDKRQVGKGAVTIEPDPTTDNAVDLRTHNRRVLDSVRRLIEGAATKADEEVTVDGVSLKRRNLKDLQEMEQKYALRVAREEEKARVAAGGTSRRNIHCQFTGA